MKAIFTENLHTHNICLRTFYMLMSGKFIELILDLNQLMTGTTAEGNNGRVVKGNGAFYVS